MFSVVKTCQELDRGIMWAQRMMPDVLVQAICSHIMNRRDIAGTVHLSEESVCVCVCVCA